MSKNLEPKKHTSPLILVDYVPATVSFKKTCRIYYYAKNPETGQLQRIVIKCNAIKNRSERLKYAKIICQKINQKLLEGWNPFIEAYAAKGYVTLEKAIESFLRQAKKLRKDTYRSYSSFCKYILEFLESKEMKMSYCFMFTRKQAIEILQSLEEKNLSGRTYNNYLKFYHLLFNFFIERGYLKENPFDRFSSQKIDKKKRGIIPSSIREKIKDYLENNDMIDFFYICQLCYRLFLRPKEILSLKLENIDFKNGLISVPADVAKNHNERVLAIPAEIMQYLNKYKEYPKEWYIFSENYKPGVHLKNARDTGRTWRDMRKALDLPQKYQFYSLKDTGITEMLEAGVPAKYVKELADHSSLSMTEKYTHKTNAQEILKYNNLEF